jgi:MFS family permease
LRSRTRAALITATVLASAVTAVDANVIKVAVPAIGRSLGMGTAARQWTLTSYLLTVAALLLLAGAPSNRFGRRRLLVVGLLITGRVVQGIGAALVVPTSLALLNGTLSPADRAPMLRLALFASRQFDAINVMTLVLYGALGAASYPC